MKKELLIALIEYIDAAVELGLAQHEEGWDAHQEKAKAEKAKKKLLDLIAPRPFSVSSGMVYDYGTNEASLIEGGKVVETQKEFIK